MKRAIIYILALTSLTACSSKLSKQIQGHWKVIDVEVKLKASQQMIKSSKAIALATQIEFMEQNCFRLNVSKNEFTKGYLKYGKYHIGDDKTLIMKPSQVFRKYYKNMSKAIKRNKETELQFATMVMKVDINTSTQLTFTESSSAGYIKYTLTKIQKGKLYSNI